MIEFHCNANTSEQISHVIMPQDNRILVFAWTYEIKRCNATSFTDEDTDVRKGHATCLLGVGSLALFLHYSVLQL